MTVLQRVMRCRLIEMTEEYPEYGEKLGLEDRSVLIGAEPEDGYEFMNIDEMAEVNACFGERRRILNEESGAELQGDGPGRDVY